MELTEEEQQVIRELYYAVNIPLSIFHGRELILSLSPVTNFNMPMILLSGLSPVLPDIWYAHTQDDLYFAGSSCGRDLLAFFGPVIPHRCSGERITHLLETFGRKPDDFLDMQNYFNTYANTDVSSMTSAAMLAVRLLKGGPVPRPEEVRYEADELFRTARTRYAPPSNNDSRALEDRLLSLVRNGDVPGVTMLTNDTMRPNVSFRTMTPALHQAFAIGAIALASRAAIEGGADYSLAVEYRTRFMDALISARSAADQAAVFIRAYTRFAELVRDVRRFSAPDALSLKVSACIQAHLYEKLTPTMLAEELGMNLSYLCARFRSSNHMTVSTAIHLAKVEEAKNLLRTGRESVLEISELLGFSSAAYFTTVFKKHTGMTPGAYRSLPPDRLPAPDGR